MPSHVKPPVVLARFQHCVASLASAMRAELFAAMVGSEKTSAGDDVQLQFVSGGGVSADAVTAAPATAAAASSAAVARGSISEGGLEDAPVPSRWG
jgi:hypothetical protein